MVQEGHCCCRAEPVDGTVERARSDRGHHGQPGQVRHLFTSPFCTHFWESQLIRRRGAAWQLEILAGNCVDEGRITLAMRAFADGIRLRVPPEEGTTGSKQFDPTISFQPNGLELHSWTEHTLWRYLLGKSTYVLEISRNRHYPKGGKGPQTKPETTWEAAMYDVEWNNTLKQQSTLAIGQKGVWEPSIRTFFPKDSQTSDTEAQDGFKAFLEQVKVAVDLLASRESSGK